jgi:hypothetical protein
VRYLAGIAGIRQFLDIGTGIPTANNTHEVAQDVEPGLVQIHRGRPGLAAPGRNQEVAAYGGLARKA